MEILEQQRNFYNSGKTRDVDFRIGLLKSLKKVIKADSEKILQALNRDLGKSRNEAFFSEIFPVIEEIDLFIKKLKSWEKPKRVKNPLTQFFSESYIYSEPFGLTLIISPWNYPFQLPLMSLIGTIGAGNCAIVKLSEYSISTSEIVAKIIDKVFQKEHVHVVFGDAKVSEDLLREKFDYIFYTGNSTIGKKVMMSAAENLTPITLELGGKSPCIVDASANLDLSAKRIVFGKFINSGQTCVTPDFILVQKNVANELTEKLKNCIIDFYSNKPLKNPDYSKIINEKHFLRLLGLISDSKVIFGGKTDYETLKIEPTLISATFDDEIMKDEIFGPLLPIIEYENLDEIISKLKSMPKPLALYYFSKNKILEEKIIKELSYGGGCINEIILHLTNPNLPFGGIGLSGMGAYHGKTSYDTFTHKKSILKKSNHFFFPHYSLMLKSKIDFIKFLLK